MIDNVERKTIYVRIHGEILPLKVLGFPCHELEISVWFQIIAIGQITKKEGENGFQAKGWSICPG
jgi:hypothetical protein